MENDRTYIIPVDTKDGEVTILLEEVYTYHTYYSTAIVGISVWEKLIDIDLQEVGFALPGEAQI